MSDFQGKFRDNLQSIGSLQISPNPTSGNPRFELAVHIFGEAKDVLQKKADWQIYPSGSPKDLGAAGKGWISIWNKRIAH